MLSDEFDVVSQDSLPAVVQWAGGSRDPAEAIEAGRAVFDGLMSACGAVLFRGLPVASAESFRSVTERLCAADWVEYREPGTPRSAVIDNVATSTEYDSRQPILLHNENSHVLSWPARVFFFCERPATDGGETPLADVRRVHDALPTSVRERALEGIIYQRVFGYGPGFKWQEVFGTDDRNSVDAYCAANYMSPTWVGDSLRVRYRRWAVLDHPVTSDRLWFNHSVIYSPYSLPDTVREAFLGAFSIDELPYSTYWGDGELINQAEIADLRALYDAHSVAFTWQRGDVLMVDNMLAAHGRRPFTGERRVLVSMKENLSAAEVAPASSYARLP